MRGHRPQGSSTSEGALQSGSEACGQTWGGCSHDWYCLQPEATPGSPGGSQLPEINPGFGFGILPIIDTATGLGQNLADHVHGSAAAVSQLVDTTLEHLTGPNLHEAVTGLTTNLGDVATSTLSQVTGLQLGGLTGDLSGLVGDTLSQITGLHLGAVTGEATAFIDGSLDPGLSVTLGAADSLIAQVGGGAASNVEALVSPIADLGFLVSGEDSNGLVWQPVDTLLSEVSGKQIVADAGNAIDSALSQRRPEDALTAGDSGADGEPRRLTSPRDLRNSVRSGLREMSHLAEPSLLLMQSAATSPTTSSPRVGTPTTDWHYNPTPNLTSPRQLTHLSARLMTASRARCRYSIFTLR